ncbi:MAG: inositol monophosphatase [Deltaproteobacteria bacterium]|nr:MAG: inositol monophosphatase [Deltaproteobacteria bacterium]
MDTARSCTLEALADSAALLAGDLPTRPAVPADIRDKEPHDYVTDLDLRVERAIADRIRASFPADAIAGEEIFDAPDTVRRWIVDPVDGTRNLVAGRPDIAVCIGLYEGRRGLVGGIGLPCRGLALLASADRPGATLHAGDAAVPLARLGAGPLDRALVGLPGALQPGHGAATIRALAGELAGRVEGLRISGALGYDLALIALGELDARVSLAAKPVDVAAGVVIIEQLGGVVTDVEGRRYQLGRRGLIAARSPEIHAGVLEALQRARSTGASAG